MTAYIIEKAPAKLNLFLHILGKRPDNFHNIESLVAFTELGDEITAEPAESFSLSVSGEFSNNVESWDNSIIKTYKVFSEIASQQNLPIKHFKVSLRKFIPVGAGLGGGSADAAALMRILIKAWKINLSEDQINKIALALGSDVPACFHSIPLYVNNTGEIEKKLEAFPSLPVVLVNPKILLPTKEVYNKFTGPYSPSINKPLAYEYSEVFNFLKSTRNDLEKTVNSIKIEISQIGHAMSKEKGAILTRMTGSGSTCYTIFESTRTAEAATNHLALKNPGWWVVNTTIQGV